MHPSRISSEGDRFLAAPGTTQCTLWCESRAGPVRFPSSSFRLRIGAAVCRRMFPEIRTKGIRVGSKSRALLRLRLQDAAGGRRGSARRPSRLGRHSTHPDVFDVDVQQGAFRRVLMVHILFSNPHAVVVEPQVGAVRANSARGTVKYPGR